MRIKPALKRIILFGLLLAAFWIFLTMLIGWLLSASMSPAPVVDAATQPQAVIFSIPCRVISASRESITCEALSDTSLGMVFSFDYGPRTRARTYPRSGRLIICYYWEGEYQPYELYDWFLLRRRGEP